MDSTHVTITPAQHESLLRHIKDALVRAGHATEETAAEIAGVVLQVVVGGAFADR